MRCDTILLSVTDPHAATRAIRSKEYPVIQGDVYDEIAFGNRGPRSLDFYGVSRVRLERIGFDVSLNEITGFPRLLVSYLVTTMDALGPGD